MARGKKKESALTPEEKLAQALVPVEEQPCQVPGNWCWTTLGSLVDTSKEKTEDFSDPDVKYVGLEHLEKDAGIIGSASAEGVKSLKNVFHPGQILYGKLRPYLNKHDVADFDGVCSTDILVFNVRKTAIAQYVDFFLNQRSFIEYAVANSKGINLPRVSEEVVLDAVCPLPPLAEQQRIVDCIEYLFAKLDEAKEKAQSVLDSFETRKAAILHKAFTGELTAKWRAEHGVNLDGWQQTTIGKESLLMTKGASPRWQGITYTDDKSQTLFVTSENVRDGYLDLTKEKYLDNRINEIQRRSVLQKGDVLVNIVGASIGRAAIFDLECLANTNQAVCLIRLKGSVVNRFLCYYLNSPVALTYYGENKVETARANISLTNISDMGIALPSVVEQHEIVSILDSLFAKEQQAKEAAEAVLEKIDLLKKSILARAFRGELGTNDPTEESAVELLKAIL